MKLPSLTPPVVLRPFLFLSFFAAPLAAQQPTPLLQEGDVVAGVGAVTRIDNLAVANGGFWVVEADTDNADTNADSVLVRSGALFLREGQALVAPVGATIGSFDAVNISNNGVSSWNLFLDGTSGGNDDSGIFRGETLLIQEGDVATAPEFGVGTVYVGFFETKVNDASDTLVLASVDDPLIATSVDRALVRVTSAGVQSVIVKEEDVPIGQVESVTDLLTGPHAFAFNNAGDAAYVVDLTGPTTDDLALYLNSSTVLAQEGAASPVGGRNWFSLSACVVDLNSAGEYVFRGRLDGDAATADLLVKNGAKLFQEGDSPASIGPFQLTGFGSGPVWIANSGDVLWYGTWDDPDGDVDSGLFLNGALVVQEGVTTVGAVAIDTLRGIQDGYALSDDGENILFEAILDDGTEGAYLLCVSNVAASSSSRNGLGGNPVGFLEAAPAIVGSNWLTSVNLTGALASIVAIGTGGPVTGLMLTGFVQGELLCLPPFLPFDVSVGGHVIPIPNDCALIGATLCTQGAAFSPGLIQLQNAIDVTIGI